MDVETQMEANGLPTQFGLTPDEPEKAPITANTTSITDTDDNTAQNPLKYSNSPIPSHSIPAPSASDTSVSPKIENMLNGSHDATDIPTTNGISRVSESLHESTSPTVTQIQSESEIQAPKSIPLTQPDLTSASNLTSSLDESIVTSSIPSVIPSSDPTNEPEPIRNTLEAPLEPITMPPQQQISDIRTSPHADERSPEAVAQIEAEKHREDSEAGLNPSTNVSDPMDISFIAETVDPVSPAPVETAPITDVGLATPPAASPPPPPEPAPATLPIDHPVEKTELPPAEPMDVQQSVQQPSLAAAEPSISLLLEKPVEPAPTPAEPAELENVSPIQQDQQMIDAPSSPPKLTREREDDDDESEHIAKRVKTDEGRQDSEPSDFKIPDVPAASPGLTNGTPSAAPLELADGDDKVTPPRLVHIKKVISNLKKSNASTAFRVPVDPVALNIPNYPEVVKNPMDLGTIDNRLKAGNHYSLVSEFTRDFNAIVDNCVMFNGRDHVVSQQAFKMQSSFNNQMAHLPRASIEEPTKEQKKAAKAKAEPTRTAPPRRPSVTAVATTPTGSARSPKAITPSQSFAPGPDGVPLIRRDSTVVDGRPKRAIVPTKRNQDFASGRPKKKKYESQLKFCQEALKEIASAKHWQINQYFTHPVDPVALNIPTYFQIIKKPMDLSMVQTKLDNNVYEKAKDFEEDVRLVFRNCYKFNPEGDFVNQCGHQLEDLFDKKWATKDEWIASHEPVSEPHSEGEEDEDEDQSDQDDEDDSDDDRHAQYLALQKRIADLTNDLGALSQPKKSKKNSKSPVPAKKRKLSKSGKKEKPGATFPNLGKSGKEKKKSSTSKSKPEKDRYVTFAEKQYISNGIAMLPEKQMQDALKIIQSSVPSLANSDQNEIELDIEEVPNHALLKLLNFVKKYAGPPPDEPKAGTDAYNAPAVSKSKKNKPMSKVEQEAQIEELKGKLGAYGGPVSPNAVPSIETGEDSSDDDGDSEESEEE